MRYVGMKLTGLTLIWIILLSVLVESGEQEDFSSPRKINPDGNRRSISKNNTGTLPEINVQTGHEDKESHKSQDHRDEDEEEFLTPGLTYTHIYPDKYRWNAWFFNNPSVINLRICCRSNHI